MGYLLTGPAIEVYPAVLLASLAALYLGSIFSPAMKTFYVPLAFMVFIVSSTALKVARDYHSYDITKEYATQVEEACYTCCIESYEHGNNAVKVILCSSGCIAVATHENSTGADISLNCVRYTP